MSDTATPTWAIDPICRRLISDADRAETLRLRDHCLAELAMIDDDELRFVRAEVPS